MIEMSRSKTLAALAYLRQIGVGVGSRPSHERRWCMSSVNPRQQFVVSSLCFLGIVCIFCDSIEVVPFLLFCTLFFLPQCAHVFRH